MINSKHLELFYKDSPFLPITSQQDITEIEKNIANGKYSLLSSITQQAGFIGQALNILHEKHLKWITDSFECTSNDIVLFYTGFTTPIILILSAIQMDVASTKTVIQNLSIATKFKLMQDHNKYKINLLHEVYYIVANKPEAKLNSVFSLLLSLLRQKPFSYNKYYNSGVDAGIYTMQKLYAMHQKQHHTTS